MKSRYITASEDTWKKIISRIISGLGVLFVRNDLCNSQFLGTTFIYLGQNSVFFFLKKFILLTVALKLMIPYNLKE